jgi:hypothetical protein
MGVLNFLNDESFNVFFSFVLGIGLVCMFRPQCLGTECDISKPPTEQDFDKFAYRMGGGKCFEFKSNLVECPSSGTIEAFRECSVMSNSESFQDQFSRRGTPIKRCE